MAKYLSYGECPMCGDSCQPPDGPDDDGLEVCFCCDCKITWIIHHTDKNRGAETYRKLWKVSEIE